MAKSASVFFSNWSTAVDSLEARLSDTDLIDPKWLKISRRCSYVTFGVSLETWTEVYLTVPESED